MATSLILGPNGQPIQKPDLEQPQTAHLAHLQRALQSHPTRGLTPTRLSQILDAAEQGDMTAQFELFEDMEEKDGHIASEMSKRRRACVLDWQVVPPHQSPTAQEVRNAAQLEELLAELPDFEDVLFDVTDGIGKGFACLELEWHKVQGFWLPKTITHRPQSWFTLHRGYRQELRLRSDKMVDGIIGEPLTPFGWLTHVHKAKSGYLERAALFRQLVWTYLFKNYSVGDLAEFLEIYGIPLRIGKYPSSASDKEKATLLRALASIGHNAAGIVPEGMLLEFKDAATGDPKAFELMISWCERNQSKVILGGTLTSGADGNASTNALGNVHNEVRKDLRDSDLRQLNTTLSRDLVYAIAALNGLAPDGPRRCSQFKLHAREIKNLTAYAQALPQLVGAGMQIQVKWAHEELGIPLAEAGEPVLSLPTAAPGQQGLPAAQAALTAQPAPSLSAPAHVDAVPQFGQDLAPAGQWVVQSWMRRIERLLTEAASVDDLQQRIANAFDELPEDELVEVMHLALVAARLAGMDAVRQEAH